MSIIPVRYTPQNSLQAWSPRRVFLFSGHMIDAPDRQTPRFPAEKEPAAARAIAETLSGLTAGPEDLGLTQGACGGDILFAEACRQRGVRLQLLQPFEEPVFIEKSVAVGNSDWVARYHAVTRRLEIPPLSAPQALGPLPPDLNAYERCNLWLLESASSYGGDRLTFICLWDGGGEGPGGTSHMVEEVRKSHGRVVWLDTRKLD